MLDPNLGRTCRIEAYRRCTKHVQKMYNIWICSFSSDCRVNWTQVAPSWCSAEAFSDLLKLFRRGTDGVYLFTTPMQAMASIRSGYLPREWIPARSARAFREQIERLGSIRTWDVFSCFLFLFLKKWTGTRMILVHVQKMYNIFRILIEVLLSMPRLGGVKINV